METKKKVFRAILQVALIIAFVGYYFSLYKGNENNISTYTNLILIFACSGSALFVRQKLESRILDILTRLNGVLLVIWIVTAVAQLVI